jgi:rhodanese-related sulfurtransferase
MSRAPIAKTTLRIPIMKTTQIVILAASLLIPAAFSQTCSKGADGRSVCASAPAPAAAAVQAEATLPTIGTDALAALVRAKAPVTILDARSGKFDDGRRIPGAKALAASADDATIAATAGAKDGLIVTYCSNPKCPASKKLAERLQALGYTNVIKYPDGIDGWVAAGQDITKAE